METTTLRITNRDVTTVFDLLGHDEDSISLAIAWGLQQCPDLLQRFVSSAIGWNRSLNEPKILIHRHEARGGITDIEIVDEGLVHLIVEAKRGWRLPGRNQLARYARRRAFRESAAKRKGLLSLSECSPEYARAHGCASKIGGVPLRHLSWRRLVELAELSERSAGLHQRRILRQLIQYLESIMASQDQESNLVFVVALGADTPKKWKLSWIDIVVKHSRYFHPVGNRWPTDPPNYLGFRYGGRLQSIHHVEDHDVIEDLSRACPGIPKTPREPHFLYHLGKALPLHKEVRTGKLYRNGRVWCALDLLLTSKTIAEASARTKTRLSR